MDPLQAASPPWCLPTRSLLLYLLGLGPGPGPPPLLPRCQLTIFSGVPAGAAGGMAAGTHSMDPGGPPGRGSAPHGCSQGPTHGLSPPTRGPS